MKKYIFGGIVILAIAATTTFNVNLTSKTNGISNVMLANVEALADESSGEGKDCWDTITTATAQSTLYCGTCSSVSGKPSAFASQKKC